MFDLWVQTDRKGRQQHLDGRAADLHALFASLARRGLATRTDVRLRNTFRLVGDSCSGAEHLGTYVVPLAISPASA